VWYVIVVVTRAWPRNAWILLGCRPGLSELGRDRGTEGLEAAVIHPGGGARPMEGATDVALVDRAPAAGGEDQVVDVVRAIGRALLLPVAPRLELGGDLGP
jgi:hypothetical protein